MRQKGAWGAGGGGGAPPGGAGRGDQNRDFYSTPRRGAGGGIKVFKAWPGGLFRPRGQPSRSVAKATDQPAARREERNPGPTQEAAGRSDERNAAGGQCSGSRPAWILGGWPGPVASAEAWHQAGRYSRRGRGSGGPGPASGGASVASFPRGLLVAVLGPDAEVGGLGQGLGFQVDGIGAVFGVDGHMPTTDQLDAEA